MTSLPVTFPHLAYLTCFCKAFQGVILKHLHYHACSHWLAYKFVVLSGYQDLLCWDQHEEHYLNGNASLCEVISQLAIAFSGNFGEMSLQKNNDVIANMKVKLTDRETMSLCFIKHDFFMNYVSLKSAATRCHWNFKWLTYTLADLKFCGQNYKVS